MNTATLDSPNSFEIPFRNFCLSSEDAPVPLLLSRRDASTAPFRRSAEEKKAQIQQNAALSGSQRRNALEMLRQQTEVEMRRALGDRNFHAFKAFNHGGFGNFRRGTSATRTMKAAFLILVVITGVGLSKRPAMMNQTFAAAFNLGMTREQPNVRATNAIPSTEFPTNNSTR